MKRKIGSLEADDNRSEKTQENKVGKIILFIIMRKTFLLVIMRKTIFENFASAREGGEAGSDPARGSDSARAVVRVGAEAPSAAQDETEESG